MDSLYRATRDMGGEAASACQTQAGCTALMWAVVRGRTDCVRALVEAGADKEAKEEVRIPIAFSD